MLKIMKAKTNNFWMVRELILNEKSSLKKKYYKRKYKKLLKENGAWIPLSADIKEVPIMPHGIKGVFISKNATIGKGCTILHQVTIGSNAFDDSKHTGSPVIIEHKESRNNKYKLL